MELSESQAEFANGETSTMVNACPGAGKTRAIVARYVNRAASSKRKGIALLSFTNAAVEEVSRRCSARHELLAHPHFVGTFDSFIQRFIYGPRFATRSLKPARFIETWDAQDITKVIPDFKKPFEFLSLESFDFDKNGAASLDPARVTGIFRQSLISIYQGKRVFCDAKAAQIRNGRIQRGYISCSEARRQTMFWLGDVKERAEIATKLAARFSEVIVDEAQDCGKEELELLRALREVGVVISIVGDPDQAIYEFRNAVPEQVLEFGKGLESQITFSDNYRSSPSICRVNSALRVAGEPDVAMGEFANCDFPVHLVEYTNLPDIGPKFRQVLNSLQLTESKSIVLSHSGKNARMAALASDDEVAVNRFCFIAAKTGILLRDPTANPRSRRRAVDQFLKRLLGLYTNIVDTSIEDAALLLGTSVAELNAVAVRLALSLDANSLSREQYATAMRQKIEALVWPTAPTLGNIAHVVSVCPDTDWRKLKLGETSQNLICGTIHSAKGLEFESVCLAIPKIGSSDNSGLQAWIAGESSESRRVLYVGASRAKRLLVIATHHDDHALVKNKLLEFEVPLSE